MADELRAENGRGLDSDFLFILRGLSHDHFFLAGRIGATHREPQTENVKPRLERRSYGASETEGPIGSLLRLFL